MKKWVMVAGVDDVGRGPLAGAVMAAAVILDPKKRIRGLADSKSLTEKQREALFPSSVNAVWHLLLVGLK